MKLLPWKLAICSITLLAASFAHCAAPEPVFLEIGKTFEVIFITDENGTAPGYYTILKHEGDGDWYYVMPKPANPAEKIDPTWKPFWINIAQAKYIFPKPDRK